MATKRQVRNELAKQGGTWDISADTLDAPSKMIWASNGGHGIAIPWGEYWKENGERKKWTAPERWQYALESIADGVQPCDMPDCDMCEEQGH